MFPLSSLFPAHSSFVLCFPQRRTDLRRAIVSDTRVTGRILISQSRRLHSVLLLLSACQFTVFRQVRLERERLGAARTAELLRRGVRLYVSAQVRPVGERLAALRAGERPLAGMRPFVTAQQPRPRERLVADRAAVLQVVRQQVHRQRRHADVQLAAVRTRPGVLAVDAAVGLLVTRQVRRRRVAAVALVAREPNDAVTAPAASVGNAVVLVATDDGRRRTSTTIATVGQLVMSGETDCSA